VLVQLAYGALYTSEDAVKRVENTDPAVQKQKAEQKHADKLAAAAASKADVKSPTATPKKKGLINFPDFAPLNVPLYRRRQTLALALSSFWSLVCVGVALLCIRSTGVIFWSFLAYVTWLLLFADFYKDGKGLKSERFRRMVWWRWFRDYFPISLHATAPLDPKEKYLFCYHPHGILSLGAFLNMGTEATGFSEKFPGINLNVLTLTSNFRIPVSQTAFASVEARGCGALTVLFPSLPFPSLSSMVSFSP
jgi:hypothetical protein